VTRQIDTFDPPEANPEVRDTRRGARPPDGPGAFVWSSLKMGWRWLTRMKSALYLLAALGVLSLVATVVPQDPNVPGTAAAWRAGTEGPGQAVASLLDGFGAFDMYGSPLFLALLLLLFLSLTACLVPRIRAWWRLTRHGRPPASRHLGSHPEQAQLTTSRSPVEVHDTVRSLLADRRFRLRDPDPANGAQRTDIAAEKGIIPREGGSLAFHLSFYVLLLAVVFGQLLGFQGQVGVVEGRAFSETQLNYWNQWPGRWWNSEDHRAFTLTLDEFHVDWIRDEPFAGTPSVFLSDVTVETTDGRVIERTIGGNDPMVVDGMKIHQLEWGYAPRIVVEVDGEVVHDAFLTAIQDTGFFRTAVKGAAADPDIGLEVALFPTAVDPDGNVVLDRGYPWPDAPLLSVNVWRGDLRMDRVQNVHTIDRTGMELVEASLPIPLGRGFETPDGVVISFPELRRWVGFQVSYRPTAPFLILGSVLMMVGLVPALYAYRRRVWIRAEATEAGDGTILTIAGRAFQRPQAFTDEFQDLVSRIRAAVDAHPDGSATTDRDPAPDGAQPTGMTR
jgi:cytochrome c biogenesis protein